MMSMSLCSGQLVVVVGGVGVVTGIIVVVDAGISDVTRREKSRKMHSSGVQSEVQQGGVVG